MCPEFPDRDNNCIKNNNSNNNKHTRHSFCFQALLHFLAENVRDCFGNVSVLMCVCVCAFVIVYLHDKKRYRLLYSYVEVGSFDSNLRHSQ